MIGLDTNVLVRYFTADDASQSLAAKRLLSRQLTPDAPGFVSLIALAELAWVLRTRYKVSRDETIGALEALASAPNLTLQDEDAVWLALDHCEQPGVGISDALIAAIGDRHGCTHTLTFDDKATRIGAMRKLNSGPTTP